MVIIPPTIYDDILLIEEQRREARYINEAIATWDKLSGASVSYPDFLTAYVNTKRTLYYRDLPANCRRN